MNPRCPALHWGDPHPVSFRRPGVVEHLFRRSTHDLIICTVPRALVATVIDKCGQATKGVWWMSWHREATKDVVACDKLRGTGKRVLIRRSLNAETRLGSLPVTCR